MFSIYWALYSRYEPLRVIQFFLQRRYSFVAWAGFLGGGFVAKLPVKVCFFLCEELLEDFGSFVFTSLMIWGLVVVCGPRGNILGVKQRKSLFVSYKEI